MEHTTPTLEKDKIKHGFGSFDALTVIVSIIFVFGFVVNIISNKNEQHKVELAKESAKNYADQLILGAVNSSKNNDRGPASVSEESNFYAGKLGKDPWGNPYQYNVIQNSYGQPVYMVVISAGPDGKLDTNLDESTIETKKTSQLHTKGDDIGYLKSFR